MMGAGAVLEPLVVLCLLLGGTWINRCDDITSESSKDFPENSQPGSPGSQASDTSRPASPDFQNIANHLHNPWQTRNVNILGMSWKLSTPDTRIFHDRLLSRLLRKFPFLVECWYWALVYWIYQISRAIPALTLQEETVDIARHHALQVISVEEKLGLFTEVSMQRWFIERSFVMTWINWIYSFIHIPGTIAFLVWLYYYTTTPHGMAGYKPLKLRTVRDQSLGPALYQTRRRTLAVCNLLAFVIFTLWPCMPPRLLSDQQVDSPEGEIGRKYGFVDTVHGENGAGSVWTENKFCNQYAAMPSLHFGYSLIIGLTVMTIPIQSCEKKALRSTFTTRGYLLRCGFLSWRRLFCITLGLLYPLTIFVAIIATANHFILDAVAGMMVYILGWWLNRTLLNLLPLEDYFLWLLRIHKPEPSLGNTQTCLIDYYTDIPSGYSGLLSVS